VVSVPR